MDQEELFNSLRKTEEKVLRKRSIHGYEEFKRPWTSPVEKLNLTEEEITELMESNRKVGKNSSVNPWFLSFSGSK